MTVATRNACRGRGFRCDDYIHDRSSAADDEIAGIAREPDAEVTVL